MSAIEIAVAAAEELTAEESRATMTRLIADRLGIGREEFLANVDAGVYGAIDDEEILQLVTLAPFAR